jgi:outer membrane receptor protein involved in Fe transport
LGLFLLFFVTGFSGRILEPSGGPVAGARVSARNAGLAQVGSAVSDESGRFSMELLPAGKYQVRVEKDGFGAWQGRVEIQSGRMAEVVVRLSLSPVRSEVTVSAEAGDVTSPEETPQRVSVVGRGLLEEQATRTLSEAVAGVTGVSEQKTAPAMASIFVRGMTGKNVGVYRDGIRYTTSAQRGGVSTFQNLVEPAGLESVDILRGPNSAQYGSDSLGGAVNLVSRAPDFAAPPRFAASGGTFFESSARAFGAQVTPVWSGDRMAVTGNVAARRINTARTGGGLDSHAAVTRFLGLPSSVMGERLPDTAFTQYGGSLHSQIRVGELSHLVAHYERSQQDGAKRYDQLLGGDGNLIADLRNLMLDFGYVRFQRFRLGPFDQISASGSYNTQREERVNQGGQGNPRASITHQYERMKVWGGQAMAERRAGEHVLTVGGELYREAAVAPAFGVNPVTGVTTITRPRIPDGARYLNYGLFVQEQWAPERARRVRFSGALRLGGASYESRAADSPLVNGRPLWPGDSLASSALSGRAGVTVRVVEQVILHTNYSRGFRAPNMTDLGTLGVQGNGNYEASYTSLEGMNGEVGNRADDRAVSSGVQVEQLRPETSDNVDYGVTWKSERVRVEVNGFWSSLGSTVVSQTLILPAGAVGMPLGDQVISRQLPTGAVYVPAATNPVLVRANYGGARMRGVEQSLRWRLSESVTLNQNWTYVYSADAVTGLPPGIEPGIPAAGGRLSVVYAPEKRRLWLEGYVDAAGRQERLSSLALSDRRTGAARSRTNIANFFNNGAVARGLVAGGILLPTGESLAQVQNRVLGNAVPAPMFTAIPGYGVAGVRVGAPLGSRTGVMADFSNLTDRNYRGVGWGVDGAGRAVTVKLRVRW